MPVAGMRRASAVTFEQAIAGARRACVSCIFLATLTVKRLLRQDTNNTKIPMPRVTGTIDCMALAEVGHGIPYGYEHIPVQSFLNNVIVSENFITSGSGLNIEPMNINETTLRSALSDPLTGALLEDAMASFCGHSYGGGTLKRVFDTMQCTTCGATVEGSSMVHNLALRAAAAAYKGDEQMSQLHFGSLWLAKRKRDGEQVQMDELKMPEKELPKSHEKDISPRARNQKKGVQYPFCVNEKVMIKGNKRTPEKFVGREACITTQCLNGWYLVQLLDNGESLRLQYRSLAKSAGDNLRVGDDAQLPLAQ